MLAKTQDTDLKYNDALFCYFRTDSSQKEAAHSYLKSSDFVASLKVEKFHVYSMDLESITCNI